MKKLALIIIAVTLLSCSKDDTPNPENGYMKVLYLGYSNTPGQPRIYTIVYGTKINDDQVTTVVSEEVYNYYMVKYTADASNKPRWKGMITQD